MGIAALRPRGAEISAIPQDSVYMPYVITFFLNLVINPACTEVL